MEKVNIIELDSNEMSLINGGGDLVDACNYVFGLWTKATYYMCQANAHGGRCY